MPTGNAIHNFFEQEIDKKYKKENKKTNIWEGFASDHDELTANITGVSLTSDCLASQQYLDQQVGSTMFSENDLLTFDGDSWISTSPISTITNNVTTTSKLEVDGVDVMAAIQNLDQEIKNLQKHLYDQSFDKGVAVMTEEIRHEVDKELIQKIIDLDEEITHNIAFDAAMKGI